MGNGCRFRSLRCVSTVLGSGGFGSPVARLIMAILLMAFLYWIWKTK
jgi:hypothetical protein